MHAYTYSIYTEREREIIMNLDPVWFEKNLSLRKERL